jgi:hypothetical protein
MGTVQGVEHVRVQVSGAAESSARTWATVDVSVGDESIFLESC